jgi:hypothetical protein
VYICMAEARVILRAHIYMSCMTEVEFAAISLSGREMEFLCVYNYNHVKAQSVLCLYKYKY